MSNAGQAVLSIGGAIIGGIFGGPAGAAWGFQLGGLAGGALFPTDLGTVSGPRLDDLRVMSSAVGAPIPIVYGTYAIAGNVIWSSGLIEKVKRKRQGGKGGPTQTVKTYTYSVNVAVGICEGEIGGIRRIWADSKLIYDARSQLEGETDEDFVTRITANEELAAKMEIYLGTEDQLADPTIESFEGAGNVSGFRGLAYAVFSEFQLADYGNRVPNFRFEVFRCAEPVVTEVREYSNEFLSPWLSAADPRHPDGVYSHRLYGTVTWKTFADAIADAEAAEGLPYSSRIYCWALSTNNSGQPQWPLEYSHDSTPIENVYVYLKVNRFDVTDYPSRPVGFEAAAAPGDEFHTQGYLTPTGDWLASLGIYVKMPTTTITVPSGYDYPDASGLTTDGRRILEWWDDSIECQREPGPPAGYTYDGSTTYKVLQKYASALTGGGAESSRYVTKYPLGPARPVGHDDYSDSAFWVAAYADAVAAGEMAAGLTYGVDYPKTQSFGYYRDVVTSVTFDDPCVITLGEVVQDICARCGLPDPQVDVSDLTEHIDGYVISRQMSGRDAISPLRTFGWFDCVESEGVLKWPTRGKASVATITADDLAAHAAGSQRPSAVETSRQQEVELPRRLRVHYAQTELYEPGEQGASRLAAGDVEVRDVEVAIAMPGEKAAAIAEVVLYDLWVSRNRHQIRLDHSWLHLEPGDAITAPIDGRQERLRIVGVDLALPGLLTIESVRDDDGVYVSYALGTPGGAGAGGAVATIGEATVVLLDLPALRDEDNDAGYYAAIDSNGTTFSGAAIFRSPDFGTTYDEVGATDLDATIGTLADALPPGPTTIIDEGNTLTVTGLDDDALESIGAASLLAGLNAAAIGADGRWEIVQFRDAELSGSPDAWLLTGLLRGRKGTEWAVGMSQAGDRFVLLDAAVMRVASNLGALGASRPHKAVLVGQTIDDASAVSFSADGVALMPYSPVHVEGAWDSGDLVISWIRRDRFGQELQPGFEIPMSEASESYEIDILDGGSPETVLRTLTATTTTVTYTAAQIGSDFGSPAPESVTVRVYQISAQIGRGYVAEATL
jgi:hypothetical protein